MQNNSNLGKCLFWKNNFVGVHIIESLGDAMNDCDHLDWTII